MTRSAVEFQPASLFPTLQPPPPPPPPRPPSVVAGATAESAGANRLPAPPPPPPQRPILPDDDRILEVLNRGPLLPFDYCYLQGQREGLVPVVQTQLVQRNPRLVSVDRTPLGIDPNADLFRCFLMRGNPNEAVTVFTAYERDICAGVVSGYFHMPEIRNHVYRHFVQLAWLQGNGLTPPAIEWLQAYDSALDRLFALIDAADTRGRARLAGRFAHWLFPLLRRLDRRDGISSYADETAIIECHEVEQLPPGRRFFWDLLGDFTLLSIVPQPAFCAFAWIKQVQFPNVVRPDIEAGQVRVVGLFSPRYLVIGLVAAIIGLMILGYGLGPVATTRSASQWILPLLLGGLPALAGLAVLATNLVFWLLYTSGSETLRNLVPHRWRRGKPKNIGYLQ